MGSKAAQSNKSGQYSLTVRGYTENVYHYSGAGAKILKDNYLQTSNISRALADIKTVDHADVVGASPVSTAPTTSSFLT